MDERESKRLRASLDRLSAATEQSNKLSAAILKASGKQPPRRPTEQGEQTLTDKTMSKYVDGMR